MLERQHHRNLDSVIPFREFSIGTCPYEEYSEFVRMKLHFHGTSFWEEGGESVSFRIETSNAGSSSTVALSLSPRRNSSCRVECEGNAGQGVFWMTVYDELLSWGTSCEIGFIAEKRIIFRGPYVAFIRGIIVEGGRIWPSSSNLTSALFFWSILCYQVGWGHVFLRLMIFLSV